MNYKISSEQDIFFDLPDLDSTATDIMKLLSN